MGDMAAERRRAFDLRGARAAELEREPALRDLPEDEPVILDLADLMADANGEVVLFNDSALRSLTLRAEPAVVAEGISGPHVTAGGEDVAGFRYLAFANGLKLFHQPDLVLRLVGTSEG